MSLFKRLCSSLHYKTGDKNGEKFPLIKYTHYQGLTHSTCNSFNGEIKSVTIFSNTKLREILEFSVYFPSTPSRLNVQVFVLLFLVTLFISPSILSLWELHALFLYKPLPLHTVVKGIHFHILPFFSLETRCPGSLQNSAPVWSGTPAATGLFAVHVA